MTPRPDPGELRRLHFINALFAHVTGRDLYLAEQIKAAIAFSLAELEAQTAAHPESAALFDAAFNAAAARLLEKFCRDRPRHGFFHWDAARTLHSATPLFARAELMAGLKQLAPHRESTLLITNLRPALLPRGRRATRAASASTRRRWSSSGPWRPGARSGTPTCNCSSSSGRFRIARGMAKTLFERIVDREIPARIEHEDDRCIVIHDIQPQAPVHLLLIPKRVIPRLGDASPSDESLLGHLLVTAGVVARKLKLERGFRLVVNHGPDACETVPHLHLHLLAKRQMNWPPG